MRRSFASRLLVAPVPKSLRHRPDDGSVVVVPRATLTRRVEVLESTVGGLVTLPARIDTLQRDLAGFRSEMQREFATVRDEIQRGLIDVRTELREEISEGFAAVRAELRGEIREGDEETRHQMRVLHEDLIERIKTIGEGIDDLRRLS